MDETRIAKEIVNMMRRGKERGRAIGKGRMENRKGEEEYMEKNRKGGG